MPKGIHPVSKEAHKNVPQSSRNGYTICHIIGLVSREEQTLHLKKISTKIVNSHLSWFDWIVLAFRPKGPRFDLKEAAKQ